MYVYTYALNSTDIFKQVLLRLEEELKQNLGYNADALGLNNMDIIREIRGVVVRTSGL